ncbi:hypothetical protein N9L47_12540 [Rhodobacteraceae bacterium]|nr:hypothetical protein [Paracoccaceae bacterium]
MSSKASAVNRQECADDYQGELMRFGRYRVAVCRDGLQWLYQRARGHRACGAARWDAIGYCTTRTALLRLHHRFCGSAAPEIARLPEHFQREAQQ